MSNETQIVDALSSVSGSLCDDCLTKAIGWTNRQQAYNVGSKIAARGVITRERGLCANCGKTKITNALPGRPTAEVVGGGQQPAVFPSRTRASSLPEPAAEETEPWHWEGHVQAAIAAHLASTGWRLTQVVDTASKSQGVDIVAQRGDQELWVTVKGYPKGTDRTNPSTQARHWFSHAMFDVVRYRTKRPDVEIGVGLPDGFTTYLNLAPTVEWLRASAPFVFFWASEDGAIREA